MSSILDRKYQRGATVAIWAEVTDWSETPVYVDPSEGVTLILTDPESVVQVNGLAMTKTETGKYVYYYNTNANSSIGWWSAKSTAQDGTGGSAKYTITTGGFLLE